jgi:two-component system sensor histidine kinase KdpD
MTSLAPCALISDMSTQASDSRLSSAILCCIGSSEQSAEHVRQAAALAKQWGCRWHAVSVQGRRITPFGAKRRILAARSLHLAASLGACTDLLYAEDVADTLVRYARDQAITTLLCGASLKSRWLRVSSLAARIARRAADLEVQIVHADHLEAITSVEPRRPSALWRSGVVSPLIALLLVAVASDLQVANILRASSLAMLMVLAVALVAVSGGRRAAIATTLVNLLIYDYVVIAPRFSLALRDVQSVVTFLVMLIVGLTIGELTHRLRSQAHAALGSEQRAYLLSAFSRNLSAQVGQEQVLEVGAATVARTFGGSVVMLLLGDDNDLRPIRPAGEIQGLDLALAHRALREGRGCGNGTSIEPRHDWLMLPLRTSSKNCGVMALRPRDARMGRAELHEIETFASLIALALERVHYLSLAQEALLGVESERLRSSLLAALSHDLQTPLASVVGLADSVLLTKPPLSERQQQMIEGIVEEGQRMSSSVGNLLEMAKLESGTVRLRLQWHSVEEAIGAALAATRRRLGARTRAVRVPHDLPLVEFDAALIERVLINLLDNAAKYTPFDAHIDIEARVGPGFLEIVVTDDGPGLPTGREDALFAKFARARSESGSGVGLGLAICRAIVVAHGGQILAQPGRERGASFIMTLPLSEPPAVASESEALSDHV